MLCSCCSDAPSPNTFGYEVFNKIPKKPKRERRYENQGYYPNNNKNYGNR